MRSGWLVLVDDLLTVGANLRRWARGACRPGLRVPVWALVLGSLGIAMVVASSVANRDALLVVQVLTGLAAAGALLWWAWETRCMTRTCALAVVGIERHISRGRRPDLRVWVHDSSAGAWWVFAAMNVGEALALRPRALPEWVSPDERVLSRFVPRAELCKIGTVAAFHAAQPGEMLYFALKAPEEGDALLVDWRDAEGGPAYWRRWRALRRPDGEWLLEPLDACSQLREGD